MNMIEKLLISVIFVFLALTSSRVLASSVEVTNTGNNEQSIDLNKKIILGERYRDQGNYALATKEFETVLTQAEKTADKPMQAMAAAASGYNFYLARDDKNAKKLLELAGMLSQSLKNPALSALIENYSGMLYLSSQQNNKAALFFANALKDAEIAHDKTLILGIRLNQVKLELNPLNRLNTLETISTRLLQLGDNPIKIKLLLNCSEQLLAINSIDFTEAKKQQLINLNYLVLNKAFQLTDSKELLRLHSEAEGYLAKLYSQQQRNQDALLWLDKAIFDAQQLNAPDLLTQWETLRAQLLHNNGELIAASESYKRAAKHLVDIRYALPVVLHNGKSSFQQIIDPIYRGLADVLLLQATKTSSDDDKQKLIREAIDSMEIIKQTELEDYFNDRCLINEKNSINLRDKILPGIAIIYPVILPDRVELLFRAGDSPRFEQQSTHVSAIEISNTAAQMSEYLRHGQGNYRPASRKLYNWLVKAYDPVMKAKGISLIIYVPGSHFRQVPLAALLNGKKFVVEDYTTVTLPGLTLKKPPESGNNRKQRALIAALSKPDGPSIDELLKDSVSGVFGERGISNMAEVSQSTTENNKPEIRSTLVQELSLPSINNEVTALQNDMANTTLMNRTFTYGGFKQAVGSGDYSIIHIASHGYFGTSADKSFVMTYDHNLKLNDFQLLLSNKNINNTPINLLTLSACQTAEGDDRALLGFSGVAIKTNALSAIGTLWSVDDAATAKFMEAFYSDLTRVPKAEALREAQLSLFKNNDTKHPHYWAPFILVGNW
jgi:CHAT domain-containing protein